MKPKDQWPEGSPHLWPDADLLDLCRTGIPEYDPWSDAGDCTFNLQFARRAIGFCADELHFIEGDRAGEAMVLEPWQAAIVGNIFGWLRAGKPGAKPVRRYRSVLLYVARKNGKTPLAAAIALYMLLCDGEQGAQVYSAAADQDQAALIFRWAEGMIARSKTMAKMVAAKRLRPYTTWKSIQFEGSSVYKALSADAHTKHGLNISCAIVEELHAHPDRRLVDALQSAKGSRRQPLFLYVTTADYARPASASICNEKYEYAKKVRAGTLKAPDFLPVIYELAPEDDWTDEATWPKANPNLDVSVSREELREQVAEAKANTGYQNEVRRLRFNQQTKTHTAAIDPQRWAACAGPHPPVAITGDTRQTLEDIVDSEPCFGALDLGSTGDTTCFLRLWRATVFHPIIVVPTFWIPELGIVERDTRDRVGYQDWVARGLMRTTPGRVTDYHVIEQAIVDFHKVTPIEVLNFDRANASDLVIRLSENHGLNCVEFGQGFLSMNAPCLELNRMLLASTFWHGGHEVLTWMAGNTQWDTKGGDFEHSEALKPSKRYSTGRIDGMTALCMAIGALLLAGPSSSWRPVAFTVGAPPDED